MSTSTPHTYYILIYEDKKNNKIQTILSRQPQYSPKPTEVFQPKPNQQDGAVAADSAYSVDKVNAEVTLQKDIRDAIEKATKLLGILKGTQLANEITNAVTTLKQADQSGKTASKDILRAINLINTIETDSKHGDDIQHKESGDEEDTTPPPLTNGSITIQQGSPNPEIGCLLSQIRFMQTGQSRTYEIMFPASTAAEQKAQLVPSSEMAFSPIEVHDLAIIARIFLVSKIHLLRVQLRELLEKQKPEDSKKIKELKEITTGYATHIKTALTIQFSLILAIIWEQYHSSVTENPSVIYDFLEPVLFGLLFSTSLFIALAFLAKTLGWTIDDQSLKENKEQHENLFRQLNKIKRELTQTNLAVTSLHFEIIPKSADQKSTKDIQDKFRDAISKAPISEQWLRKLDIDLKTKESVVSIEKVIMARQRDVDDAMQEYEENKTKSRRAITSSIGGLAAGFITYEMGAAVKYYVQLKKGQDPISFGFWLEAIVQHGSAPGAYDQIMLTKTGEKPKCDTIPNLALQEDKDFFAIEFDNEGSKYKGSAYTQVTESKTAGTEAVSVQECLQSHLRDHYQQSEMLSQAWLLTIVLIVSSVAAAIGWKKGADGI